MSAVSSVDICQRDRRYLSRRPTLFSELSPTGVVCVFVVWWKLKIWSNLFKTRFSGNHAFETKEPTISVPQWKLRTFSFFTTNWSRRAGLILAPAPFLPPKTLFLHSSHFVQRDVVGLRLFLPNFVFGTFYQILSRPCVVSLSLSSPSPPSRCHAISRTIVTSSLFSIQPFVALLLSCTVAVCADISLHCLHSRRRIKRSRHHKGRKEQDITRE